MRDVVDLEAFNQKILRVLLHWSNSGDMINQMGTRLIGHVPQIAPKAYMHVVYAPLSDVQLQELTGRLKTSLPSQFTELLSCANGSSLFLGKLRVLGYVPQKRSADTSVYNYPSSILIPNVSARLQGLSERAVVVGWYKADGSHVSIESDGTAVRFGPSGPIQTWPDFDSWLLSEVLSLGRAELIKPSDALKQPLH